MIPVWNQIRMSCILVALYMVYNQCIISIYLKDLDPQVNGCFELHDARFIFNDIVCTIKSQPSNEGYVKILWGHQHCPDTMAYNIGGTIKNKSSSLPWLGFFIIIYDHDIFIREIESHWLVILY